MRTEPEFFDPRIAGWWVWGISQWIGSGWAHKKAERKIPQLASSSGVHKRSLQEGDVEAWFQVLSDRFRRVRVACGDWSRVTVLAVTKSIGLTGVFLDPPYERFERVYGVKGKSISSSVRDWAIKNGDDPKMRIALCGYEGEHQMPPSWECFKWTANGGFSNRNPENQNRFKERIWFSPHCLIQP